MSSKTRHFTKHTLAVMALAASCVALASCSKAAKQTLRLNLVPGSSYILSVRTSVDAIITAPDGNSVPFPATSLNTFTLNAGEVDAQGNSYASVEVGDTEFPMVFVPLGPILKGQTFGMKLSPVGRITEFVNTEPMREAMRATLEGMGTGSTVYGDTPPARAIAHISDDALRAIIEPITAVWPETPVGPGDEWTGPEVYSPLTHTITATHYRLESADEAEITIHADMEIRPAGDHPRDPNLGPVGDVSGKGSGEIRIDPMQGTIRAYDATQEISGSIRAGNGGDSKVTSTVKIQGTLTAR
jgi:hypothetical protein